MATVNEIFDYFEKIVPTSLKMESDNPGFLAGDGNRDVKKVMLALDITEEVIQEAKEYGAELILSHHPMFFDLKNVSTRDLNGRKVVALLENHMAAICLHTNLDAVQGGVNDTLLERLGARTEGILEPYGTAPDGQPYGMGRYGTVEETTLPEFLAFVKKALRANGLRYIDAGRPVHRIAVVGGSGGSMVTDAVNAGCDTYVTADIKHSVFLEAKARGINLIDAGHYSTENVVIPVLEKLLKAGFPELETKISTVHRQPEQYYV